MCGWRILLPLLGIHTTCGGTAWGLAASNGAQGTSKMEVVSQRGAPPGQVSSGWAAAGKPASGDILPRVSSWDLSPHMEINTYTCCHAHSTPLPSQSLLFVILSSYFWFQILLIRRSKILRVFTNSAQTLDPKSAEQNQLNQIYLWTTHARICPDMKMVPTSSSTLGSWLCHVAWIVDQTLA